MNRVLIIEPDKYAANLYKEVIEKVGNQVVVVHDAQNALNELDINLPDVVMLELDIPDHNGLEFLYEFCSYYDWKHIPIIG